MTPAPESVFGTLPGRGSPLPAAPRAFFEATFGQSLAGVRLHADARAGGLAAAIGATAFTIGRDIVFAPGRLRPDSAAGTRLLAHELAHVLQNDRAPDGGAHVIRRDTPAATASADAAITARAAAAPTATAGPADPLDAAGVRAGLRAGRYRDAKVLWGSGPVPFVRFLDTGLEALRTELEQRWLAAAPAPPKAGVRAAAPTGDSTGEQVASHPDWVKQFTDRLVAQNPRVRMGERIPVTPVKNAWDEDSAAAQQLIEAYMLAWHRKEIDPNAIPINVQELYARIGASAQNAEANLLGGEAGGPNWCGPAAERSIGLALMRRGLRLKTGKAMVAAPKTKPSRSDVAAWKAWQLKASEAFAHEVHNQGVHWITNGGWQKTRKFDDYTEEDFERVVQRPTCYWTPVKSGDYMYLKTYQGPVSGHVALAIRERPLLDPAGWKDAAPGTPLSELIIVSGNAKDRAVRQEAVIRERSHYTILTADKQGKEIAPMRVEFDYLGTSGVGNAYDAAKTKRGNTIKAATAPFRPARDAAIAKLAAWAPKGQFVPNPFMAAPKPGAKAQMLPMAALPGLAKDAPETLRPHFQSAPAWAEYFGLAMSIQAAAVPAQKTFDAEITALKVVAQEKFAGMPLTRSDEHWDAANTIKAPAGGHVTGLRAPAVPRNVWVVAILRGSRFARIDEEIAKARTGSASEADALEAVASTNDVERTPGSIEDLYGDALQYWSTSSADPAPAGP